MFDIERAEPLIGRRADNHDAADIPYTTGQRQCARNRTDGKSMTRPPPDQWSRPFIFMARDVQDAQVRRRPGMAESHPGEIDSLACARSPLRGGLRPPSPHQMHRYALQLVDPSRTVELIPTNTDK